MGSGSTTFRKPSPALVVAMLALFVSLGGTALAIQKNSVKSKHIVNGQVKEADTNTGQVQARVDGSCAPGMSIRSIAENGTVTCETVGGGGSPTGAAGGDLAGSSYPNPVIAPGAVNSTKVEDESLGTSDLGVGSVETSEIGTFAVKTSDIETSAVTEFKIAASAVLASEIANDAVGSAELAGISEISDPTPWDFGDQNEGNNDYEYGTSTVECPAGTQVIGGGFNWSGSGQGGGGGDELQAITESMWSTVNGWVVKGVSDVDNQDLQAIAYCLATGV